MLRWRPRLGGIPAMLTPPPPCPSLPLQPSAWTPEKLRDLEPESLDLLARGAGKALVISRLLIGRCLEETDRRNLAWEWGYSGPIHHARRALRLSGKAAREARRVARDLVPLAKLSEAAEAGEIGWSHLREVVRVATPQTEEAWLEARLRQAQALLGEMHDLRERQERQEDARARSAALRAWRQGQCAAAGGDGASRDEEAQGEVETSRWGEEHLVGGAAWPTRVAVQTAQVACPARDTGAPVEGARPARDTVAPVEVACPTRDTGPAPGGEREGRRARAVERGAQTRRGSAEARRQVQRRDGFACMCPDCPHTIWLHSHHLTLYCRGGLSVPSNQVLLCSKCHGNVHRGRLQITGTPETGLVWRDARGLPLGEAPALTARQARGMARRLLAQAMG